MVASTESPSARDAVTTMLTLKLIAISGFAVALNWLAMAAMGSSVLVGVALFVLGNVAVLWLVVDALVGAFDELLSARLEA
ncbi:hypothetical protein [Natronolimnohabitans innermongolicus]|uniref:Uncharacterized protein n=1 Tax=Natronolimnohabitans innermongolicus JCM 12255 TaxID=1227499 RepID=L9X4K1_9EURY|nr:hypothetical protein [Natronolimnohabitans innermongolicus]ELY56635.1 hypothetical protein C493_09685 [Natronolimnohabitans innermongolicus JCM 12255]